LALLDNAGGEPTRADRQVDLIEEAVDRARVFVLVLDHADTEKYGNNVDVEEHRLELQADFIRTTFIFYLKEFRSKAKEAIPLRGIIVVMNKADVWESKPSAGRIRDWAEQQAKLLREEFRCDVPICYLSVEHEAHPGFAEFTQKLKHYCGG
jgi:hypothetical protein